MIKERIFDKFISNLTNINLLIRDITISEVTIERLTVLLSKLI